MPDIEGMYVDERDSGFSFRNYGKYLLLGGGGHRTGKQGGSWSELESFSRENFPNAREVCRWAAQDCMTLDGVPYIGEYSPRTPDLYVAAGFNKWGMTSAMAAAEILRDMILGRKNDFAEVFSPARTMLRPQLLANIWESGIHLLKPTVPRCPHMGCRLVYNPREKLWECPCHGSQFDRLGRVLSAPAVSDADIGKH